MCQPAVTPRDGAWVVYGMVCGVGSGGCGRNGRWDVGAVKVWGVFPALTPLRGRGVLCGGAGLILFCANIILCQHKANTLNEDGNRRA